MGPTTACQGPARDALLAGINSQLPAGYQIDESQLDDLTVSVDPATGDLTIAGKMYAGAAKDPAALVDALRRFVADGGNLDLGGGTTVSVDSGDIDDGAAQCMNDANRVAAKMCDPGEAPPASYIPGGTASGSGAGSDGSKDAGNMAADDTAKDGDSTMLVVGTVLITLAVVAGIVGIVMGIKVMNKRRNTVSSDLNRFDTLEGNGQRLQNPADAFELVGPVPQQLAVPVWGDVVQVQKPVSSNRIPSADKNF